jgi:hypothetical protein
MHQITSRSQRFLLPLLLGLALPAICFGYVETFEDGTNTDTWQLTTATQWTIEPTGGNPDAYLFQETDAATPTWYTSPRSHFLGNLANRGVTELSADIDIFAGISAGLRNMTLNLGTTFGTGDPSQGVTAYYIGDNITRLPEGWNTYTFEVPAASSTIPDGWVVTRGNGRPGNDADWRALMRDVESLGFELGTPGYFYPVWIWDLGLDNVRLSTRQGTGF